MEFAKELGIDIQSLDSDEIKDLVVKVEDKEFNIPHDRVGVSSVLKVCTRDEVVELKKPVTVEFMEYLVLYLKTWPEVAPPKPGHGHVDPKNLLGNEGLVWEEKLYSLDTFQKIKYLEPYIVAADYLGCDKLLEKLSALMAMYISIVPKPSDLLQIHAT
jgi:hypothetical protein